MNVTEFHMPRNGGHLNGVSLIADSGHLINDLKDALGTRNGALQVGPQQRNLLHGLVKLLHKANKGDDEPQRNDAASQRSAAKDDEPPNARHNGDADVA